ncbi:glycosyltransferase [Streptomyces sp. NPDC020125]|uniref:glycosyltransferase n=1 Tax=Streptomyces sp. NPDC020125 TaxID=3154593 RepID=UPI0033CBCB40
MTRADHCRAVPWVVICDYPNWPSPYFAQFEAAVADRLDLHFQPDLSGLAEQPPGIVNLHRLKRLYRDASGRPDLNLAHGLVRRLGALRDRGWRVVWTVHNLYPIDRARLTEADGTATAGVLALADAVLCHTRSDAAHIRSLGASRGRVETCGWAGPLAPAAPTPSAHSAGITAAMRDSHAFLILGNIARYKDVPGLVEEFRRADIEDSRLYVVGPCRDADLEASITRLIHHDERVVRWARRVEPDQVRHFHDAARVAVCTYRAEGGQRFFTQALYPSSVGTAVVCGVPLVAPRLRSVVEMTQGHPAFLYDTPGELSGALVRAAGTPDTRGRRPERDENAQWKKIAEAHIEVASVWAGRPHGTARGDRL